MGSSSQLFSPSAAQHPSLLSPRPLCSKGHSPRLLRPRNRALTWVLGTAVKLPLCGREAGEGVESPRARTHTPSGAHTLTIMAHTYWAASMGAALILLIRSLLHHIPGAAEGRGGMRGEHTVSDGLPTSTLRDTARSGLPARLCTASRTPLSPSSTYLIVPLPSPCVPRALKGIAAGAMLPQAPPSFSDA